MSIEFRVVELNADGCKVMGTPHLTGVAWLLLQHKDTLGDKVIDGITVFSSDKSTGKLTSDNVNILVEVKERSTES